MTERWLVIAHEATNSGAPRILLQVLQGARALRGPEWSCDILLRRGGVLAAEFARIGRIHLLSHPWAEGRSLRARLFARFFERRWIQPRRFGHWMKSWGSAGFDLVYNNTATNGYLAPAARRLGCPILTHVHELGPALRRFNTPTALAQTVMNTDQFIAVSPPVAADLIECGVPADRITVVPNFLPTLPSAPDAASRLILRQQLELPLDAIVIIGCGHIDRIKGTDLFVEMAAALSERTQRALCFIWIGGVTDARFAKHVRRLARQRNIDRAIRFAGPVDNSSRWFAASDIVAVTSRLESFSLVALEAAALGRPVVGFSGARGLASVHGDDSALLAPEHDVSALVAIIERLMQNSQYAEELAQRLRARVAAEFLAPQGIEAVLSVVDKLRKFPRARA